MVTDESVVLVKEEEVAVVAFSVDGMRRLRSNRTPEVEDGEEGVCLVVDSNEDEELRHLLRLTINGLAAGMRSSG